MKYTYEIEIGELSKVEVLKRTDENGIVSFIPMDEANSDYQAYLASLEAPTAQQSVAVLIQPPLGVRFFLPRKGQGDG